MARVRNYINNKDLFQAMEEHRKKYIESSNNGTMKPQVSKYIGESIMLICNNLSKRPNFFSYTYRDEMIDDGIMDCIAAVDNFDPEKTNNPFAYFTMIAWNAFIRRIQKEKKQTYIKHKNFQQVYMNEALGDGGYYNVPQPVNEHSDEVIKTFEEKLTKNKKEGKIKEKGGLEKFTE
jgi:hypothetical protein